MQMMHVVFGFEIEIEFVFEFVFGITCMHVHPSASWPPPDAAGKGRHTAAHPGRSGAG